MFIRTFDVSRSWFSLLALLSLGGVALERGLIRWAIRKLQAAGKVRRPALLVSKSGVAWPSTFVSENDEFDVVAHIDPDALRRYAQASRRERNDGRFVDWAKAAVILRASEFEEDELWSLLMDAGQAGCSVYLHSSVRSIGRDRLTVRDLGGTTIVKISPPRFEGVPAILKRSMDLTVAGGMLLALSPVLVLLALGILITSGRPILYGQDRVGRNGKVFRMLKFRSMSTDAESQTGAVWAKKGDPRVTPLGRILRRTSLDELPQLFNILLGDMSLVGPRPERPIFVDQFAKELSWYQYRHRIRPGLTGWAQAHGLRGNTSLEQRVDFDNWYIEHWSPGLDLRIMFRTLWEVFQGDHAY